MWNQGWRDETWATVQRMWDIVIVGAGITGAGILREATRQGLETLLIEQADFAWGTSSRSSKLVHGGLRYLKEGRIRLTRDSVREREQLLHDAPGLVEPLDFLLATYGGERPGRFVYSAGLTLYDLLALRWSHRYYSAQEFRLMAGQLSQEGLEGGFRYGDAQTDDARLVLRVLREAVADGGTALNYARAERLLHHEDSRVRGILLRDLVGQRTAEVEARIVINAAGAWADRLRTQTGQAARIRPLRGSHLIFPAWRLPAAQAVTFLHPVDWRPVFLLPWEGVTLVGTTDEDHRQPLDTEPRISGTEVAYLMKAIDARYPALGIDLDDVLATYSGVRPVIGSGHIDPSQESRDHIVWRENGLITVTGGKLTTFRLIAEEVLGEVGQVLGSIAPVDINAPILNPVGPPQPGADGLSEDVLRRLLGRYGSEAAAVLAAAGPGELERIPQTNIQWAELRWAARSEGVVHLQDLLLRRVRLGLLLEDGGAAHMERIRAICQAELGWDDARWRKEENAYAWLWQRCHALPPRSSIPDWRSVPSAAFAAAAPAVGQAPVNRRLRGMWKASSVLLLSGIALLFIWRLGRVWAKLSRAHVLHEAS